MNLAFIAGIAILVLALNIIILGGMIWLAVWLLRALGVGI